MSFPSLPVDGQVVIVNNVSYTYDLTNELWYRNGQTSANVILTDTANIVATTTSTSTTTGALKVAGGVGIVGNLNVGGTTFLTGDLLPTSNNTVNIGSPTQRFGTVYLAANTIDLGGTTISTAPSGELVFATQAGNVSLSTNTISFLTTIANTSTDSGNLTVTGNLIANKVYANSYFYANGAALTGGGGSVGYTGSIGYTGSQGDSGNTGTTGYTGSSGSFSGTTSLAIATSNSTASTSTTTGALQVSGGAGIAGNIYAGAVYTGGIYWSGNGAVISTGGGGGTAGGYLNMVMTGAVIPPVVGVARLYPPVDMTITTVYANLSSAPSNGNMTFVIKKNGTSIGTTFTLSTALMTPVTVSVALTTTDYLTIDVAGSSSADLRVTLKYV